MARSIKTATAWPGAAEAILAQMEPIRLSLAEASQFARGIAESADREIAWAVFSDWLQERGVAGAHDKWAALLAEKPLLNLTAFGEQPSWLGCNSDGCCDNTCLAGLGRHLSSKGIDQGLYRKYVYESKADAWADLVLACVRSTGAALE